MLELQYIGSSLLSETASLYFFRICNGKSNKGISNSILVFWRALLIHHVPSSASDRFSFVSERISLYEMPVKQENRNMSRTR